MLDISYTWKILTRKSEYIRPLRRRMNSCGDNIKIGIDGIVWEVVGWSYLTQFSTQCWAVVNLFKTKIIVPCVQNLSL